MAPTNDNRPGAMPRLQIEVLEPGARAKHRAQKEGVAAWLE